ncbi:hypothetical protein JW905_07835, partial [bacterium]|nr:hypothetical protein [candidate division CSSED10-310 bacterium]
LGTLEAIIRIWTNQPGLPVDLSEQQVFSCAGGDCPTGLYMGTIFSYVTANGVADEECLPYIAVDDNCGDLCDDWQQRSEYIDGWDLLWQYQYDDEVLKSWVMLHPVACYMEVYGDFMSYSSGIYEHVTGTYRGGHFVVIVGWDDAENYWICKNSWGLDWGEDGYFRIKRGETAIGSWAMFPYYPGQPNPTVTPAPYPTPLPTATASPDLGVRLHMPHTIYRSGDTFSLDATISNPGAAMSGIPVFIVLETGGEYWFWPGWKAFPELDCQLRTIHNGMEMLQIIDPFPWPEMPYTGTTAAFWGLMLTGDFTQVLGDSDQAGFTF